MAKTKRARNAKIKEGHTFEEIAEFFDVSISRVRVWEEDNAPLHSLPQTYDWLIQNGGNPGRRFSPPPEFWDETESEAPVDDGKEIRQLLKRTREAEKQAYELWEEAKKEESGNVDRRMRSYRDILRTRLDLEKIAGDLYANNTKYVHVSLFPRLMAVILPTIAKELQGFPKMMAPKVNEEFPDLARDELEAGCLQLMKTINGAAVKYLGAEFDFNFEE